MFCLHVCLCVCVGGGLNSLELELYTGVSSHVGLNLDPPKRSRRSQEKVFPELEALLQ